MRCNMASIKLSKVIGLSLFSLLMLLNVFAIESSQITCSVKTSNGRKQADCKGLGLTDIPNDLGSLDIRELAMDNNQIQMLRNYVFKDNKLSDLHIVSFRNCGIREIEKFAFAGLGGLYQITLSDNLIHRIEPGTFDGVARLRDLYLMGNLLETLETGLFRNHSFINRIDFSSNNIATVETKAFENVTNMNSINLNGNKLRNLKKTAFDIPSIRWMGLQENPWLCDCTLREFYVWCKSKNLFSRPTLCTEPEHLKGREWDYITEAEFACRPEIFYDEPSVTTAIDSNVTLSCRTTGDPKPEVHWALNGNVINGTNSVYGTRYVLREEYKDNDYRVDLVIKNVNSNDRGTYHCIAANQGGIAERNVTVLVSMDKFASAVNDIWILLFCLFIGILCALILIALLCYLCCRRGDTIFAKKPLNGPILANGDIAHHIILEPEQEKTLLNPVQKPPRKYESSPRLDSTTGTELTELNRNLLDDGSVMGTSVMGDSMDDRRSNDSVGQLSSCNSQDNLLYVDRRYRSHNHHPPDLLAFPRGSSPAGSAPDDYRRAAVHSPVRSPQHPFHPSYDTLPYPRTRSPIYSPTGGAPPVSMHRQGYVTIPRRPRAPSWSSAPTPTIEELKSPIGEPTYDNLGPRTTSDGSSVISLPRKVNAETPKGRPLPNVPYTSQTLPTKAKLNRVYLSMKRDEPCFQPISPDRRMRNGPETGTLKKAKVPPEPPPKLKLVGPLFEDEGEDGTEV